MCLATVGVLGDLSRALEDQLYPYCDQIMTVLLANLQSDELNRSVKPQILGVFGDLAMAIQDRFENYAPHVLQMLQSAQVGPQVVWLAFGD